MALDSYGERLMRELRPNEPLLDVLRGLEGARVPARDPHQQCARVAAALDAAAARGLFELIVDSGFEGVRKPEPEIYELTLERLGLPPGVRVRRRRSKST